MKKRNLIALLMAVCMMFSLLPVNAIAVGDEGTIPAEETLLSENGNDSAPAGSTNPAGDKDSIPDTGDKPGAAEEPGKDEESAKDEESGKNEEPAKGEESGKDEEPAEGEEGGKTNVVPMRVVRPDTDKYLTYVFRVDGAEVSRQIVKKGDTLYQPVSPAKDGYKFTGWFVGASELTFGTVGEISESAQINVNAGFTEVLYVFFADTNGRIVHTKEGVKGDVIKTDDVTYGLENTTHAITGWYLEGGYQTPVDSVTLDKENITVYAKVEPGHWLHFDSDGGTYVAPQFYSADATTAAPNVVTKPGYTFSHWEYNGTKFEFGSPLTENITLKAHWNVNTSTRYTVIHWQEDADDDGYSYVENETLYGTTGAQTSARAKTYNGFTVRAITQETIKGNGATIVNIYYKRNVYEVKFYRRTSGFSGWSEMTNKTISAKYGANIRDQWPGGQWKVSPSGSVYQTNIDVMSLGGTSFYETSQYNGSAKYYLEDLNGNYVLDHTDTGASTTANISKEDRYNITGFTVNESKSGKDGERYNGASFYYDRNSYNVVYISHGQTVNTASYKYQQSIADAGNYKLTTPPVGMEKYIFAGWCADPFGLPEYVFDGKTMPAQNITVYAYWAAPTVYGFAHITMEGADGKELIIPYGGTIDESMLPDPQKPAGEGWTFAGWATKNGDTYTPFHFSTKIYENIELYPYYTNKSSYTVTYTDGKDTVTDMKRYASGAHADVQANSFAVPEGKVFLGWAETAGGAVKYQPNDKLRMDASVTLYAVWGDTEGVLSLVYMPNGGTENAVTEEQIPNNSKVTLKGAIFTRPGYTLTGWNTAADGSGTSFALGAFARVTRIDSNVLYAQWKANNDTAYKVEFYCEQTDGNYTLKKTEPRTGTTDATVSVTDGDKAYGTPTYVYDADNANNVESGPVAADGTLTLKLYFKRNTAEYTIHHYLKGTEVKVAPDQTGTMTIGDTLTASASTALGAEYTSAHVDSYSPSQSLEMKATGNVITVYYTVPLTITAESASRAYNAQPLTQPDFKVKGLVNGDQKTDITLSMTKESTITNVGSVPNVIDTTTVRFKGGALPGGYYELPTYQPGTLTITPNTDEVTVTITGNHNTLVYNGSEQSVTGYTTDVGTKTIDVALKDGVKAEAKGTDVDTYYMGLTKDSFSVTSRNYSNIKVVVKDGWLKIDPIADKVTVTVTENSAAVTYDGTEHSVTGYKSMTADNTLYDVEKNVAEKPTKAWTAKGTDAGEYPVGIVSGDFRNTSKNFTNVEFVIVDGTLKIDPVSDKVTVTVTENSAAVTYDGTEHSVTGYKSMTADNTLYDVEKNVAEKPTAAWTAKGTYVGTYHVGIKAADFENKSGNFANVEFVIVDGDLVITPASVAVVKIEGHTKTVTYNGKEQTVEGYTITSNPANATVTLVGTAIASGTDANTYPMGLTAANFTATSPNYEKVHVEVTDGYLKINPITDKVTVTVTENADTVIYDTKEHSVTGYKSMTADNALYDVKKNVAETSTEAWTAKGTDVGEYPVGIKAGDFENTSGNFTNVEFVIVDGALKIAPAESIVVKIAGNTKTVTYNGEEQSVEGYTVTSNPANADVTLVGKAVAAGTDADTYPMGLTAADFTATSPNYETVVIKVTDGWLKINPVSDKVTVTVTEKSDSVVYDGQEHAVTGYETMAADNALYNTADVAETPTDAWTAKGTNAGKYQVGIKSGDFKNTSVNFTNVAFVIVDGELEITPVTDKVTVTVVEKSDNVTYDAAEHSITGYETMTADNALYDIANVAKTPTAAWTAKGTEAGEYPVGIVSGDFKNTSKNFANVEFVIVDGALTITTDDTEVVVTVTGNTKTVVYDGTEHSVEGYTVDVNGLPITVTPKAGTAAKASGTNAGTYYMGLTADDFTAESNNYSNIRIAVTDGWLKIDPITDKVTVTVTENADTVEYDGKEHSVTGYASIVSDHALYDVANVAETPTDAWTAKGTDAGTYPVGIKSGDFRNTSGNFTNVEFVIEDGELVITRRGENPGSPVTLRADDSTVMFDGDYHGYVGHIATNLAEGHSVRSVKSDFTARNVGRYEDKIDLHDAIIVDADGKDVTRNYVLTYQPGTLEITPFEGEVVVTVTGNTGLFRYDGKIHTVEGYTWEATVPFFTEDDIRFTGDATISEVRPGDYVMNLKDEEFSAANDNFTSVKFVVIDGSMRIYTVRYTVAWMFDTDQMLTGDSPNRYFTSMANYIDRSDISLVLHSGNVVADAGAQSQWDVFNNAMQPLYDDEDVDVLMIAAEKEAASGSLFLQQPVREDFKEEDLFENGKGFVRRFNIGEKSVILVGLGADAMTEEGYKWAREKFNSDKDASGILLVNNYLLEDMRKPDKIDERALDLEKNVVKACSNVRMVLSSSGGYSSHYEFYYGERKVIAINSDIEAAAKAGYFTQLTFNEDLNILSVTNLCPYTYDFVYNERQAYKECYVLNNVL